MSKGFLPRLRRAASAPAARAERVRELAAAGTSSTEIARRVKLPQDAVALLLRTDAGGTWQLGRAA